MDGLPEEQVQAALDELLGWPAIARSPQLGRFLSYIVAAKLRGDEASIKAYAIAVDVLGRPASFDPQSDPIVRVQARRLRTLLTQFYDEGLGKAGVQIRLPVGRYVPEFVPAAGGTMPAAGQPPDRPAMPAAFRARHDRLVPIVAALGVVVLVVGAVVFFARPPDTGPPPVAAPGLPAVLVGEFSNLTGIAELGPFGQRLAEEIESGLARFEDFGVSRAPPAGTATQPYPEGTYLVDGLINAAPRGIEVSAVLTGSSGETLWTGSFAQPAPVTGEADVLAALVRAVVREIAPFRGPLHERGRRWLDEQSRPLEAVNDYSCLLAYRFARESGASSHISDALACYEKLLVRQPDLPAALSAVAWLETRAIIARRLPADDPAVALAEPLQQAQRAAGLAPGSSLAHEHVGAILNWPNAFEAARREFEEALRLNPLNTDARANYAVVLARDGNWQAGREQAERAIADTPYPSPWYDYPIAVEAFRSGDFEMAMQAGLRADRFEGDSTAMLVATAAAARLGEAAQVEALLPRALGSEALRRTGVRPWLEMQLRDPATVDGLTQALREAGMPDSALTGPF